MATSINQNYTKIENISGALSELIVSDAKLSSVTANSVTVDSLNQVNALPGVGTLHEVVAYAPSSFSTLAINGILFLNNSPGAAAATAVTDDNLFLLPTGAQVVSAVVTNNGTTITGGTSYDIGTEVWTATPTGNADIAAAMTLATVNAGGTVGLPAGSALGSAGSPYTPLAAAAANTGVTVQALTSANTAGDLAVRISYLL